MRGARAGMFAAGVAAVLLAGAESGGAGNGMRPAASLAPPPIVTGIDAGGGPWIGAHDAGGRWLQGFLAFFDFSLGGLNVAAGDVDGDGRAEIVTVPGWGGRGEVRVFDATGGRKSPTVLAAPFGSGAQVAAGDVTGDGRADLVAGNDRGGGPNVQVFDGATGLRLALFGVFRDSTGRHGVRVAAGDVNGDGRAEVITGGDQPGDQALVGVFSGVPTTFFPEPLRRFRPFGNELTSGLHVAAGDVNGDGRADIAVAGETMAGPQVKIFDAATAALFAAFVPFESVASGSLRVAAADVDGDGRADVVAAGDTASGPQIRVFSATGAPLYYLPGMRSQETIAAADLDGDGKAEIVAGAGPGYDSHVTVLGRAGVRTGFEAYYPSFTNGVRVAAGDVDGDGTAESIAGQGAGGGSELDVFDGEGRALLALRPFPGFPGIGVFTGAGDVDGDRKAEVLVGADAGGEPRVKVYDRTGRELASFLAFDATFRGGVRVAGGDLDGDGKAEIVAGAGPGGEPLVRVFDAAGRLLASFAAFSPFSSSGVYVASGDVDGDGKGEIVAGAGQGSDPYVRVFAANGEPRALFRAYEAGFSGGVRVAVGDVDRDGKGEIVTGPGRIRAVDVRIFTGAGRRLGEFRANPDYQGGLFVGMPVSLGPRLAATGLDASLVEGKAPSLTVATFVDPAATELPEDFAATISWGDGSRSRGTVASVGTGHYRVTGLGLYPRAGRYAVEVGISDRFLRGAVARTTVTVHDTPTRAQGRTLAAQAGRRLAGVVAVVADGNPLAEPRDFAATIDWGDGTSSRGRLGGIRVGRFAVRGSHRFRVPGTYRVLVRVREVGGGSVVARSSVRVSG